MNNIKSKQLLGKLLCRKKYSYCCKICWQLWLQQTVVEKQQHCSSIQQSVVKSIVNYCKQQSAVKSDTQTAYGCFPTKYHSQQFQKKRDHYTSGLTRHPERGGHQGGHAIYLGGGAPGGTQFFWVGAPIVVYHMFFRYHNFHMGGTWGGT